MGSGATREIQSEADVEEVMRAELAFIYKHSPLCGVSRHARGEVRRFAEAHPEVPVYQVNVVWHRALSREVERRLGIRHQSPQAILVRSGRPLWHDSHLRLTVEALEGALRAGAGAEDTA